MFCNKENSKPEFIATLANDKFNPPPDSVLIGHIDREYRQSELSSDKRNRPTVIQVVRN